MLDSNVLEVAIGMIVCFASISLIASSLQEAFASLVRLRASTLLTGIVQLLNGQDADGKSLIVDIYNHALVNPRGDGKTVNFDDISKKITPSYIDSMDFAQALVDALKKRQKQGEDFRATLKAIPDQQLSQCFCSLYDRAQANVGNFESAIAKWFDSAMARVSGVYKRRAQLMTFIFAFFVAVALNIDAFRVMTRLWSVSTHGMLHVQVLTMDLGPHGALTSLAQLPIGWVHGQDHSCTAIFSALPGWIIAATSALFGAPFWFGLLERVAVLRGAGAKPNPPNTRLPPADSATT
ncbi:hypothetical protein ACFFJT_17765 [Dyella flava]|uniref:Uncharacterized protein n=1 Tax=Dyella flava TaxID=1920170 RepID=A0ABS2JZW3_9GAMM|nr:hypothetical protein [Dyella flava]MBM7124545.1 hypothetical protein [Dyella flava]GLQ51781.1 hypothetical protein GCM10010872_32300 [Dyella flava]